MIHNINLPWAKPPITANEARSSKHYRALNDAKRIVDSAMWVALGGRTSSRLRPVHSPVEVTLLGRLNEDRVAA